MCLQDVKLNKSYEVRGSRPGYSASSVSIIVKQAGNRRLVRFSLDGNLAADVVGAVVYWLPENVPISLGYLTLGNPVIELRFQEHGAVCYGPFAVTDPNITGVGYGLTELLANTDEEKVV